MNNNIFKFFENIISLISYFLFRSCSQILRITLYIDFLPRNCTENCRFWLNFSKRSHTRQEIWWSQHIGSLWTNFSSFVQQLWDIFFSFRIKFKYIKRSHVKTILVFYRISNTKWILFCLLNHISLTPCNRFLRTLTLLL